MACVKENTIPIEHEEEILVLKSIFNEDFVSIEDDNHLFKYDLIIHFDSLTKKILLIHDETNKSIELSHLPPITLRIIYKLTYPELNPPDYCILCDYLNCDQLFSLVNQIDTLWKAGEVIVYTWIEYIKDYFSNLNHQLILSSNQSSIIDQRFLTNYNKIDSKQIYDQLVEYNQIQTKIEFEQTNHICPICFEEKPGNNCIQFEKCNHYACLLCLNSYARESLSNIHQTKQINCYQCNSSLFLSEIRRIFSDDQLFLKYQQYLTDMTWCPRCHHSIVSIPSESQSGNHPSFVECLYCQFIFCRRCQQSWHPQIKCPKDEMIEKMIENHKDKPQQFDHVKLKHILLEIESILTIEECSKPCPACNVRIEKNGGCQHMHCRACNIHFCWTCGWYGPVYSFHPCRVKLEKIPTGHQFDIDEKVLYDENGNKLQKEIRKRVQVCPRTDCRQTQVKIGTNNMILCGKCEKYFCFLCGEAVYGKFHFSEYGCKINTPI